MVRAISGKNILCGEPAAFPDVSDENDHDEREEGPEEATS
jgi:hypothetical protein